LPPLTRAHLITRLLNNITMQLSTIVISEFHQKVSAVELLSTGNFRTLPFNVDDATTTGDIAFKLGSGVRGDQSRAEFKDDIKLMAQASSANLDFIITDDLDTLAKYCRKLADVGVYKPEVIVVSEGFTAAHFNGGQATIDDKK